MRAKQKARTRAVIVAAAGELLRDGAEPGLDAIAERAGVSRATAYRYFSGLDALLGEAAGEVLLPPPAEAPGDPFERLAQLDEAVDTACRKQPAAVRLTLARGGERDDRRRALLEQALAPLAARLGKARGERLVQALALAIGPEAFVALDGAGLDRDEAREVRRWAIDALIAAALNEAYSAG